MITKNRINHWAGSLSCGMAALLLALGSLSSCSDMLETESTRYNIEPSIGEKTDSVFYAFGILQAMQQLADQYVFQGELRGDLVKTTFHTDNNLRQLANFSATTANKYDSAYVYYRVINNCNYYIAHCDTALYTGSINVVKDKYVAAKAIRAWAYLQLGRNYKTVPFFLEPLTQISQIDRSYPELTLSELVGQLAPDLEQYSGMKVPTLGYPSTLLGVGSPNWSSNTKFVFFKSCFIPVDVVLGDMYCEAGNFDAAARHFVTYLTKVAEPGMVTSPYMAPLASKRISTGRFGMDADDDLPDPNLMSISIMSSPEWSDIFLSTAGEPYDIITYIPMAATRVNGPTSDVPLTFGFDYYSTPEETGRDGAPYIDQVQLLPSDALNTLSDSTEYYFYARHAGQTSLFDSISIAQCGDMRLRSIIHQELEDDSTHQWIDKYRNANIVLYRTSTVWLRLAECFNRLGMPDAAFAILKDGICEELVSRTATGDYLVDYLSNESRQKLVTTYPLLADENLYLFPSTAVRGIHTHGAGHAASDCPRVTQTFGGDYYKGASPYQFNRIVGRKMAELTASGFPVGTTKQDTINAVEDIICDEYALEHAFEGNRFYDLCRMARHKNQSGIYGGNYGSLWLARKLAFKQPVKDLTIEDNWYLPFK